MGHVSLQPDAAGDSPVRVIEEMRLRSSIQATQTASPALPTKPLAVRARKSCAPTLRSTMS